MSQVFNFLFDLYKIQDKLELALKVTKIPPNTVMVTTLQWRNRHGKNCVFHFYNSWLTLMPSIKWIKLKLKKELRWKRYLATLQIICKLIFEFSQRKSTPNRNFKMSGGYNSVMTKLTGKKLCLAHKQLLINSYVKYQVNQGKTEGEDQQTRFLQTDHWV